MCRYWTGGQSVCYGSGLVVGVPYFVPAGRPPPEARWTDTVAGHGFDGRYPHVTDDTSPRSARPLFAGYGVKTSEVLVPLSQKTVKRTAAGPFHLW